MKKSLFDKIWESHVVEELQGGNALIFVDLVVAHEITSPQGIIAIEKDFGDKLYDPNRIVSLIDHVAPAKDTATAIQAQTLRSWAKRQKIRFHDIGDNGICHVIIPEKGYVTPGMVIACGDSHTGTLGAFGTFALGVGSTAQAGAMLAQVLVLQRPKVMKIEVTGELAPDVTAKDLILTIIKTIGFKGGTGYALEYCGSAISKLSMDGRMTVCNMAIEAGATAGVIAPDEKTAAYLAETTLKPTNWTSIQPDPDAEYDRVVTIDGASVRPVVTWGTNPGENSSDRRHRAGRCERGFARIHGPHAGHRDEKHRDRSSLHRFVHQLAHQRSARGGRRTARAARHRADDHHARFGRREATSRTRRAARRLPRCRMLVDALVVRAVPRHVGRRHRAANARDLVDQPQLPRAHGRRRPRAPRFAASRGGVGDSGPHRVAQRRSGRPRSGAGMIVKGSVLPIPRANVDTDQIIPAKHLTTIDESGMGEYCFTGMTDGRALLGGASGRGRVGRGRERRLRLVARTRGLGAARRRLSRP